jgi:hypothetical protein
MRAWALLLLVSCDGNSSKSETVAEICTQVVQCGTYGWSDQAECETAWIDNSDYGTECAYDAQYFTCAEECLLYDCDDFEECEYFCWLSYCL